MITAPSQPTTDDQTMTNAVLAAVADYKGVDKTELDAPLFDAIRPEALDRLFADTTGEVTFEYLETVVTIDSQKQVTVRSSEAIQ